jgi:mannose-6-phosphate isomerase-like protein (cupin superfamily)
MDLTSRDTDLDRKEEPMKHERPGWMWTLLPVILLAWLLLPAQDKPAAQATAGSHQAIAAPYETLKWEVMEPHLGQDSPQISILRVDPVTKATHLLIRNTSAVHVPMHWHSANETHTMIRGHAVFEHDGKRHKLGPGGFNYIPARGHHQAWLQADTLVFITVDGAWDVNWVHGPPQKSDVGKAAPPER